MKLLLTLLTSSKLEYLLESYRCANEQKDVTIDYDILIIVNTLKDEYFEDVKKAFSNKNVEICRTKSNGFPGKGHNSVIDQFKKRDEYDYLLQIDGDDFLYPFAISHLEKVIFEHKPDLCFLGYHDNIATTYGNNRLSFPILNKCYLFFNYLDMKDLWLKSKKSPFTNSLESVNTPGRIMILSKNAALTMNLKYSENLKWYDDLYPMLQVLQYIKLNKYKIYLLCTNDILIYNKLNEESSTANFQKDVIKNYSEENKQFQKLIKNKFLDIRDWDLKLTKIINIKSDDRFTIWDKINYCKYLLYNLDEKSIDIKRDNFKLFKQYGYENNIEEFKFLYSLIY